MTIDLPNDVFLKATFLAVERSMTFTDAGVQCLKLVIETTSETDQKARKAALRRLLRAVQASNTEPMIRGTLSNYNFSGKPYYNNLLHVFGVKFKSEEKRIAK